MNQYKVKVITNNGDQVERIIIARDIIHAWNKLFIYGYNIRSGIKEVLVIEKVSDL